MKKALIILLGFLVIMPLTAQNKTNKPLTLPPLDIKQANGTVFRLYDIRPGIPVMLVYFDPGCDHCEVFINKLTAAMDAFEGIQIIMVTYVPVSQMQTYIKKKGLDGRQNVVYGTEEENFAVRYHYNIFRFPYVALHDKNGKLLATFESEVPEPADLARLLK